MKILLAAFAARVSISAAAVAADETAIIEAQNQKFVEVFEAGDAAGVAALYAEGGVVLPPGGEAVTGTDAVTAFWQGAMDSGVKGLDLTTVDVFAIDKENIVEVGRAELFDADGGLIQAGHYIVYWRKEGGDWKLFRDIWN